MNALRVIRPGMLSLIEDGGRTGYGAIGITPGGPADRYSARWANHLLGNRPGSPLLEITLGGARFEALGPLRIALTGADAPLTINDVPRPLWHRYLLKKGDVVALGMARRGLRVYLATEGGWQCRPKLGSCAATLREHLGEALETGALLRGAPPTASALPAHVPPRFQRAFDPDLTLRVVASYHHDLFPLSARECFFSQRYRVTTATDRMGCRLSGKAIDTPGEILSEPTTLGAVQIPSDGQPIVLLAERQTIGGYPVIGTVIPCDVDRLAQAQPGSRVMFRPVSLAAARRLWRSDASCPPQCEAYV